MTSWHEFGEWAAILLNALGFTEEGFNRWRKWLGLPPCWCANRREWLNELGEEFWSWWFNKSYWSARSRFEWCALAAVQGQLKEENALHSHLSCFVPMSRAGCRRWLDRLERENLLSHVDIFRKMDGFPVKVRLYGLARTPVFPVRRSA